MRITESQVSIVYNGTIIEPIGSTKILRMFIGAIFFMRPSCEKKKSSVYSGLCVLGQVAKRQETVNYADFHSDAIQYNCMRQFFNGWHPMHFVEGQKAKGKFSLDN